MRELPEPGVWDAGDTDGFTRDQVLAIQKQAYEDGLRDATPKDSYYDLWNALQRIDSIACTMPSFEVRHDGGLDAFVQNIIDAMLTASQKEQQ